MSVQYPLHQRVKHPGTLTNNITLGAPRFSSRIRNIKWFGNVYIEVSKLIFQLLVMDGRLWSGYLDY